ncbi:MAG: hypothetical protein ABFD49_05300 [Armatimonadota bacterium]|nr:hypothetical protein [bacterium]
MQLGKSAGGDKQNPIVAVVAIVIILAAGFMVYRNIAANRSPTVMPADSRGSVPVSSGPIMPGGSSPDAQSQPGAAPAAPATPSPSASQAAPVSQPAPAPQAAPAPKANPAPAPQRTAQVAKEIQMKTIKVFGSVTVSYPDGWKISASRGNTSALFTNGAASFEVLAPDAKANSAKAIALAALKSIAPGASVKSQGAGNLNGSDIYWVGLTRGGQKMRIVGVDAATRVVLVMRAPSGKFASHADVFNKMQNALSFGR